MIEIRRIAVSIESGPILLNEISLDLKRPEIVGVFGPNGSGKSTFLRALRGDKAPGWIHQGELWLNNKRIDTLPAKEKAQVCLRVGSEVRIEFPLTVREALDLTADLVPMRVGVNIDQVLQWTQLAVLASRQISTLSDGEKQRFLLARALLQRSDLILFDETFSKVDPQFLQTIGKCLKWLREVGVALFVVSHDINFLSEISDQLVFLKFGKCFEQGKTENVLNEKTITEVYPGVEFQMLRSAVSGKIKVVF